MYRTFSNDIWTYFCFKCCNYKAKCDLLGTHICITSQANCTSVNVTRLLDLRWCLCIRNCIANFARKQFSRTLSNKQQTILEECDSSNMHTSYLLCWLSFSAGMQKGNVRNPLELSLEFRRELLETQQALPIFQSFHFQFFLLRQ